jgi:hypothetical protein
MGSQAIIVSIVGSAVIGIIGVAGYFLYGWWQRRKAQEDKELAIHFEDIKRFFGSYIFLMAQSLKIRDDRLCYEIGYGNYYSVSEQYDFEEQERYVCFKSHFPLIINEWKSLNAEALKYNKPIKEAALRESMTEMFKIANQENSVSTKSRKYHANQNEQLYSEIEKLQGRFKSFALRANDELEKTSKYGMGRKFKKIKGCPICEKI